MSIHRRQFLRGSGAVLLLPFLESLIGERAYAQAANTKRFVTLYMPNGTALYHNQGANWWARTSGDFSGMSSLPPIFSPFASQMNEVTLMRGLRNHEPYRTPFGGDHSIGMSGFLTCAHATSNETTCTIQGDSIDWLMRNSLGGKDPIVISGGGSADVRADSTAYPYGEYVSYKDRKGVNGIKNPVALATSLIGATAAVTDMALARNPSVLDSLTASITRLNTRLTASDRAKLDDYLTSLRELEVKVKATPPTVSPGCTTAPTVASSLNNEDFYCNKLDFPERLKAFMDLIVFAFKCDMHRIVTLNFDAETATRRFRGKIPTSLLYNGTQIYDEENHIDVAHHEGLPVKNDRCISRDRFYLSYMFYLMNQLRSTTDAAGVPLLDNTLILSGFGIAEGNHTATGYDIGMYGLPVLLAGGKNLMRTGRQLHMPSNTDLRGLHLAIMQRLGHNVSSFNGYTSAINLG